MTSFTYATTVCNIIASISVVSALLVITVTNPVSSVLWLITSFIGVAGYLVTAGMTYIGLSYVIVYVGAIAVLFLFVVIILNVTAGEVSQANISHSTRNTWPLAIMIIAITTYGLSPLTYSEDFTLPQSVISVMNLAWLSGIHADSDMLTATGEVVHQWWGIDIDMSITNASQVQVLGITLYTSGALWLLLISVLLILAMLVPLALAYTG